MELLRELSVVSERMNNILQAIDPETHRVYSELRQLMTAKYAWYAAFAAIDPLVWIGRSLIFNRATPEHLDSNDAVAGWAALLPLGYFEGGEICIPHLGLVIKFPGGTLGLIRGTILKHYILAFFGGQRVSTAHFVHQSSLNEFGLRIGN